MLACLGSPRAYFIGRVPGARSTMTLPPQTETKARAKSQRFTFYVVLAVAIVLVMVAARIMGMPRGTSVDEHKPEQPTTGSSTPPPEH